MNAKETMLVVCHLCFTLESPVCGIIKIFCNRFGLKTKVMTEALSQVKTHASEQVSDKVKFL